MLRHLPIFAAIAVSISMSGSGGPIGHFPVTYEKDVKQILDRKCTACHRIGGLAPMPLTTYEEALPWATAIAAAVGKGEMPPPNINAHPGPVGTGGSLTPEEIDLIFRWVLGGAPEKNPLDTGIYGRTK